MNDINSNDKMVINYLSEIFTKQKHLQKIIEKKDPTRHLYKTEEPFEGYRIFMIATALLHETVELQRETNWKWWKQSTPTNRKKIKEESIDIWHFLIQLSLEIGLTPEEIYTTYLDKHKENINRQNTNY